MNRGVSALAVVAACAVIAGQALRADEPDRARPELWREYSRLKKKLDEDLAALRDYLQSLEPGSFTANYGKLAQLTASKDPRQRQRAIKAIAALQDVAGLPVLVTAMGHTDRNTVRQSATHLSDWIYGAYHAAGKTPPEKLRPLLPLFVKTLVEAKDEPNLRAYCFQAIGCLADSEWLPLIKDLSASRHGAVKTWSDWAVRQLVARSPVAIQIDYPQADPLLKATYVVPEAELTIIRRDVRLLINEPAVSVDGLARRYSKGISHFDNWIPMPSTPLRAAPARGDCYGWYFRAGRVARVDLIKGKIATALYTVWHDEAGAPILCVSHTGQGHGRFAWGDYDGRGLLRRVVHLSKELQPVRVDLFENANGYESTAQYSFGRQGKLTSRVRYAKDGLFVLDIKTSRDRRVNSGARRWWIKRPERYGLASIYPIPPARKKLAARTNERFQRTAYDPTKIRLKIVRLVVNPTAVEKQCTGELVIRNVGPAYPDPVNVILPSYVIFIYDKDDKLIFCAGGAWGGGMKPGQEMSFNWDTHSNTLREAQGRPFLFPVPGRYKLRIELRPGQIKKALDSQAVSFVVGLREASFGAAR